MGPPRPRRSAREKAKELIAGTVAKAALLEPLEERQVDVTPAALVIGGGIAGLEAALDIADAGYQVYLVERQPSLGGRMAQLNKTFPRMEDAGALVVSEMERADGPPQRRGAGLQRGGGRRGLRRQFRGDGPAQAALRGSGQVHGLRQVRRGLRPERPDRRRVPDGPGPAGGHLPAVPRGAAGHLHRRSGPLPAAHGGRVRRHGPPCALACPEDAVDFGQREEESTLKVGAIVVATGYDPFDPERKPEFGYGRYPGVLSALEFERLAAANGPTGGRSGHPRHRPGAGARGVYPLRRLAGQADWATTTARGCAACTPPSRPTSSWTNCPTPA